MAEPLPEGPAVRYRTLPAQLHYGANEKFAAPLHDWFFALSQDQPVLLHRSQLDEKPGSMVCPQTGAEESYELAMQWRGRSDAVCCPVCSCVLTLVTSKASLMSSSYFYRCPNCRWTSADRGADEPMVASSREQLAAAVREAEAEKEAGADMDLLRLRLEDSLCPASRRDVIFTDGGGRPHSLTLSRAGHLTWRCGDQRGGKQRPEVISAVRYSDAAGELALTAAAGGRVIAKPRIAAPAHGTAARLQLLERLRDLAAAARVPGGSSRERVELTGVDGVASPTTPRLRERVGMMNVSSGSFGGMDQKSRGLSAGITTREQVDAFEEHLRSGRDCGLAPPAAVSLEEAARVDREPSAPRSRLSIPSAPAATPIRIPFISVPAALHYTGGGGRDMVVGGWDPGTSKFQMNRGAAALVPRVTLSAEPPARLQHGQLFNVDLLLLNQAPTEVTVSSLAVVSSKLCEVSLPLSDGRVTLDGVDSEHTEQSPSPYTATPKEPQPAEVVQKWCNRAVLRCLLSAKLEAAGGGPPMLSWGEGPGFVMKFDLNFVVRQSVLQSTIFLFVTIPLATCLHSE